MPIYDAFLGRNFVSARHNYFYRNKYRAHAYDRIMGTKTSKDALKDYHFAEMILYGKVDRHHLPICLRRDRPGTVTSKTKSIKNSADPKRPAEVLSFVADAFKNLTVELNKAVICKKIDPNHPYLSNIKAYRGISSYDRAYNMWLKASGQVFIFDYLPGLDVNLNRKYIFNNFDQFVDQLMLFFERMVKTRPITLNGFIKSRFCLPHVSGLVIDIADLDNSFDQDKIDIFIKSQNYQFFLAAAKQHGFYVDHFVPWRLYANINSDVMKNTISKSGHNFRTPEALFKMYYDHAHMPGYQLFKRFIINVYNTYHLFHPYRGGYAACKNGATISKVEKLTPTPRNIIFSRKDESYFLKLYAKIRNMEEENLIPSAEIDQMVQRAAQTADEYNISNALMYLESALSTNVTKTGSLTDRDLRIRLISEAKDDTMYRVRLNNLATSKPNAIGKHGALPDAYEIDHHDSGDYDSLDLGFDPYDL